MLEILNFTAPVFILLLLGFISVKSGYFKDKGIDGIGLYVFNIATPVLLFHTLSSLDIGRFFDIGMIAGYFTAVFINYLLVFTFMSKVRKLGLRESVASCVGGTFSNSVLVGIPLITSYMGVEKASPLFILIAFHAPILLSMAAIGMSLADHSNDRTKLVDRLKVIFFDLVKNPIIISILLGLSWNFLDFELSGWPEELLGKISKTAGPTALFAVGASLTRYKLSHSLTDVAFLTLFKLVIFPLLVFTFVYVILQVPEDLAKIAVIVASLPAGVNSYLIAIYYQTGASINSGTIFLSTTISMFTLPFVLFLLEIY